MKMGAAAKAAAPIFPQFQNTFGKNIRPEKK